MSANRAEILSIPACCWLGHHRFCSTLVLMATLILAGCNRNKREPAPTSSHVAPSSIAIQDSPLASPFAYARPLSEQIAFRAKDPDTGIENTQKVRNAEQANRLRNLPHLSGMSEQDLFKLEKQLRGKPLSQRQILLKNYPSLAGLPTQQQQLLLGQLAEIVSDATPAMHVTCTCKSGPKHEMCLKEECGQTASLSVTCESLCGAANISSTSCMPSKQCGGK
jgi:hypothetical protein